MKNKKNKFLLFLNNLYLLSVNIAKIIKYLIFNIIIYKNL